LIKADHKKVYIAELLFLAMLCRLFVLGHIPTNSEEMLSVVQVNCPSPMRQVRPLPPGLLGVTLKAEQALFIPHIPAQM
jgi:hypothetical protein